MTQSVVYKWGLMRMLQFKFYLYTGWWSFYNGINSQLLLCQKGDFYLNNYRTLCPDYHLPFLNERYLSFYAFLFRNATWKDVQINNTRDTKSFVICLLWDFFGTHMFRKWCSRWKSFQWMNPLYTQFNWVFSSVPFLYFRYLLSCMISMFVWSNRNGNQYN